MEYNQFSDIKGIFKNFFHKKEDFNNKGLISKKENFGAKSPDRSLGTGALIFFVSGAILLISLYFVRLLPQFVGKWDAMFAFFYVSAFALSVFVYYYYVGGDEEISDMLEEGKVPLMVWVWLVFIVAMTLAVRKLLLGSIFPPPPPVPPASPPA